jgi:hypothetical protein
MKRRKRKGMLLIWLVEEEVDGEHWEEAKLKVDDEDGGNEEEGGRMDEDDEEAELPNDGAILLLLKLGNWLKVKK